GATRWRPGAWRYERGQRQVQAGQRRRGRVRGVRAQDPPGGAAPGRQRRGPGRRPRGRVCARHLRRGALDRDGDRAQGPRDRALGARRAVSEISNLVLSLADNKQLLGLRYADWATRAPSIEVLQHRLRKMLAEERYHFLHGRSWLRSGIEGGPLEEAWLEAIAWFGPPDGDTAKLHESGALSLGPAELLARLEEQLEIKAP